MVEGILQACVVEQKLQAFYPPGSLGQIAQRVAQSGAVETIASNWKVDKELAMDTIRLALFDVVLLVDDSGSMAFEVRTLLLRAEMVATDTDSPLFPINRREESESMTSSSVSLSSLFRLLRVLS